ncbi:HAD family hydrolase [Ignavigranum ruoffiae]|uniref:Haloacid dehalogenase-like hydrolase n=1 Tax=Ignavigranum ruoffiae TaxID=89093 RepID=A0A1H9F7F4_9LACT|nr:HAD family hydrolase [Ignavigranum ruoffiae]UPQ85964.1 HAD family hydrolase [Ignavigranum ruoffiae]SEQ33862.1 hypothetical protein SAMN04488558_10898 [Ignavigranum ruoffiae]
MDLDLVVIDLDETLLRSNKTYDRDRFARIKQGLSDRGCLLMIATGNSYHKVVDYFDQDEGRDIYFATDNGNYIVQNGQPIHVAKVDPNIIQPALAYITSQPGYYPMITDGTITYFRQEKPSVMKQFWQYNNNAETIDQFADLPADFAVTKIAIHTEHNLAESKTMAQELGRRFPTSTVVTSGEGWIDLISQHGGKGSAVQFLENKRQIQPAKAMAFGDSLNDLSMMERVAYSMAMGNADPDLLAACRYQIASNEEQAVLDILERYLREGNLDFLTAYQHSKGVNHG